MSLSEREAQWSGWLRSAMAGDATAYRRFLDAVTPHLRAMAHRHSRAFGGSQDDIEDIVQEVLLAVHLKRGTWDTSRPVGPWLSAIVRNKLVDVLRQKGRRPTVPIEDVVEALAAPEDDDGLQAYDIDRMIDRLKGVQQDIVRSISRDGSSVRETAGRLNMTEGAVRVALHRALRALAAAYRGQT
ncbi:sigma-70 family RNA polymerase sigma factor [Aquabacter sp. CN5-332]|uniref:sigma-70 family RNA polymerase sigma factor n=1 Tax=Aquabacter sp. CN5-332 TaxID=3156608 RepID=UPI0032B4A34C